MAIQQSKRQSDLEKRLQILRRQVYGKSPEHSENSEIQMIRKSESQIIRNSDIFGALSHSDQTQLGSGSFRSDLTYLHQDLLKILLLASLAIGAQIILFIFAKNHILNLNFF